MSAEEVAAPAQDDVSHQKLDVLIKMMSDLSSQTRDPSGQGKAMECIFIYPGINHTSSDSNL